MATRTGPVDITGWSLTLSVSSEENPAEANYVVQLTGTIDDAAEGKAHFTPAAGEVDLAGRYYYDIEATFGDGSKRTIAKGEIIFTQDISK